VPKYIDLSKDLQKYYSVKLANSEYDFKKNEKSFHCLVLCAETNISKFGGDLFFPKKRNKYE